MNGGLIDGNLVTGDNLRPVPFGGGIYDDGTATLTNVEIQDNSALTSASGEGGGFYVTSTASLRIDGGTVSNNSASTGNGGYIEFGATYSATNCYIPDNVNYGF
jgi:hypothetical protein